ncbi:MAG: 3-isopropylmalate dehydrogenase [Propionibacteriaceae bacterium]|nr:3-isopropylmalate dehydrogenase [Propionibacteriaceae bacterium]
MTDNTLIAPASSQGNHRETISVIPGDGIGPEVVAEGLKVLKAVVGDDYDFEFHKLGADRWKATGEVLPDSELEELRQTRAIILGAVGAAPGDKTMPSGILERGLLLKIRFAFDQYINLRPSKLYPGVHTPLADWVVERGPVDFVVVREGTEGLYAGNGGRFRKGTHHEVATEVSLNTAYGVERVVRDAFERAQRRRNKVTLVHKHNVLVNAGGLWNETFNRIAAEFPNVETDYLHIDAATIMLVQDPQRFDVIVTDNLFGDILTDEAGAVTGGIGLSASANINGTGEFPSMFEPVHGSAPDIAGKHIADPRATILSMAMLLDHLGRPEDAKRIEKAVDDDIAKHGMEQRHTEQVGDAIASAV